MIMSGRKLGAKADFPFSDSTLMQGSFLRLSYSDFAPMHSDFGPCETERL